MVTWTNKFKCLLPSGGEVWNSIKHSIEWLLFNHILKNYKEPVIRDRGKNVWQMCEFSLTQTIFPLFHGCINPPGHICNCLSHFSSVIVPKGGHAALHLDIDLYIFFRWDVLQPNNNWCIQSVSDVYDLRLLVLLSTLYVTESEYIYML